MIKVVDVFVTCLYAQSISVHVSNGRAEPSISSRKSISRSAIPSRSIRCFPWRGCPWKRSVLVHFDPVIAGSFPTFPSAIVIFSIMGWSITIPWWDCFPDIFHGAKSLGGVTKEGLRGMIKLSRFRSCKSGPDPVVACMIIIVVMWEILPVWCF